MLETDLVVLDDTKRVIGYVRNFGCENSRCTTAIINGRKWHAIPAKAGVILDDYHFNSVEAALQALHEMDRDNR